MGLKSFTAVAAFALAGSIAKAQSNVSFTDKYSWGENLGWLNWGDAGDRSLGVRMTARYLCGYVWSENAGWISLGNPVVLTSPSGPFQHADAASQTGADFGVNIDPATGSLSGYAWGESAGWVSFGPWIQSPPQQAARITRPGGLLNGRLNGFAWSENAGWINLDVASEGEYVGFCYANCDGSTSAPILNINDFHCFLNAFAAGDLWANCDGSTVAPVLNVNDFQCFVNQFAAGCS